MSSRLRFCNAPEGLASGVLKPLRFRLSDAYAALMLLTLLLGRAVQAADATTAGSVETFRIGLTAAPTTLDPRLASDATSVRIARLLYQSPVTLDGSGRPQPSLTEWSQLAPLHYRFRLRGTPTFSDGTPLTPTDVVATYQNILAPGSRSPHQGSLAHIERIAVTGAEEFDVWLKRVDPMLPARLGVGVLPAENPDTLLGSGPFRLLAWPTDSRLVLERRRDGARFEFLTLKDGTVRILKLARGELDLVPDGVAFELIDWIGRQSEVRVIAAGGTTFSYLGVNFADPLLADRRVREAIALAIDREAVVKYLFRKRARPAVSLLPPDHWSSAPELNPYPFNPERSRALLDAVRAECGIVGPIRLSYKTSSNPFRLRLATILKSQLDAVGIVLDIQSYDWGTFFADVKSGRFEVYSLSWVGLKLPEIYRYVFHSESLPPSGANRGRYKNPEVDRLIDSAEQRSTLAGQVPLWQAVQRLVHHDLAYIPLWYEDRVAAIRTDMDGFVVPPDGNWDSLGEVSRRQVTGAR